MTAVELLERGFALFNENKLHDAGTAFHSAVETGNLNDAGRTVAYWHIHLTELANGNSEASAEALASFLVVATDVLENRDEFSYPEESSDDFTYRFDVERRIARARATLSAIWAVKVHDYGRSLLRPVIIRSDAELAYFLELVPPCGQDQERRVLRMPPLATGPMKTERVTVRCKGAEQGIEYFFTAAQP